MKRQQTPSQQFLRETLPRFLGIMLLTCLSLLLFTSSGYWRLFQLVPVIGVIVPVIIYIVAVYGLNRDRDHYPFNAASAVFFGLLEGASIGSFLALLINPNVGMLFGYALLFGTLGGLVLVIYARRSEKPLRTKRCFLTIAVPSFLLTVPISFLYTSAIRSVVILLCPLLFAWFIVKERDYISVQGTSPLEDAVTMSLDLIMLKPLLRKMKIQ